MRGRGMSDRFFVETWRPFTLVPEAQAEFRVFDDAMAWLRERLSADPSRIGRFRTTGQISRDQAKQLDRHRIEHI